VDKQAYDAGVQLATEWFLKMAGRLPYSLPRMLPTAAETTRKLVLHEVREAAKKSPEMFSGIAEYLETAASDPKRWKELRKMLGF